MEDMMVDDADRNDPPDPSQTRESEETSDSTDDYQETEENPDYQEPEEHPIMPTPKPAESNVTSDQEYEVEDVLKARRTKDGTLEYLLKWKNYPLSQSTWQAENQMNQPLKDYISSKVIPIVKKGRPPSLQKK